MERPERNRKVYISYTGFTVYRKVSKKFAQTARPLKLR